MIFFKNKKRLIQISSLLLIIGMFFMAPQFSSLAEASQLGTDMKIAGDESTQDFGTAGVSDEEPGKVAKWILTSSLQFLQAISGFVLGVGISLVDLTLSDKLYDQVFFAPASVTAINTGWGLVRDFVNMFFILVLIFVAIATILRVNKFSDKKFIVYVVSAALFVNFSKPITMFVIDLSNLAMSFFMSNIREGDASYGSALMNAANSGEIFKSDTQKASTIGMYVSWFVEIVFKFIMGIMLLGLGLSLIVRLIALWVLIVLSPLAFFAIALPGTAISQVKSAWLNKLTYWCFYGPIMLFFFWLALVLVSAIGLNVANGDPELQMAALNDSNFVIGALKVLIPYASCIYMLFYGFDLSKKMASQAGDGAAWGLGKSMALLGAGAAAGKWAGSSAGRGMLNATHLPALGSNIKERYQKNTQAGALQRKAFMPGGNLSNAEHKANLVDDVNKEWDKKGAPDAKELDKIMKTRPTFAKTVGNAVGATETRAQAEARRKAAAIKLAEQGKLKGDSYSQAMSLFANDQKNLEKFEKAAKKKNRKEYIDHKAEKGSVEAVDRAVLEKNTGRVGGPMSKEEENSFREGAKEDARKSAYQEELKGMNLSEIMEQSSEFLDEKHVKDYLRENTGASKSDKRFTVDQIRKQAAENLDETKQKILAKERFFASGAGEMSEKEERDALRGMSE